MTKRTLLLSPSLLIGSIIFIAAFFRGATSHYLMLAVTSLWLSFNILPKLYASYKKALAGYRKQAELRKNEQQEKLQQERQQTEITKRLSEATPPVRESDKEAMEHWIMMHVSMRVTEKLKSAYSDATWKYEKKPDTIAISHGDAFRIIVNDAGDYTHADIHFDKYSRIHIEMLIVSDFGSKCAADENKAVKPPAIVDAKVWYTLVGQPVLDKVITNLNTCGHTNLKINEKGEIITTRNQKDTIHETMRQFPCKNYWREIINLLTADELHADMSGDYLTVSWIQ